ncbi:MAG: hypothetical protein L0Y73_08655, partial [Candidatus Aminicenantes bacterium]|nr:hypothetical protein [Candidatus Aminicenantes bacterium]
MKKYTLIYTLLLMVIFFCFPAIRAVSEREEKVDYKKETEELYLKLKKTRTNYTAIFHLDKNFKNRWGQLEERYNEAEKFYQQGDYFTAKVRFEKILEDLKYLADNRDTLTDEIPPKKIEPQEKDPCSEETAIFRAAYLAEQNKNIPRAIELFNRIIDSKCLPANDLAYTKKFINEKREQVLENIDKLKQSLRSEEKSRIVSETQEILKGFANIDPKWAGQFEKLLKAYNYTKQPEIKTGVTPTKEPESKTDSKPEEKVEKKTEYPARTGIKTGEAGTAYFLALDVWQSAWMQDFNETGLQTLFKYLDKNRIKDINLNPGLPMGPKFNDESYKQFKPIVDAFYAAGVEKINFLYAELDYPLEHYAEFLAKHPELGIDTIVDDSEFTDVYIDRFSRNLSAAHRWGIKYAAFATLEVHGNSGVSDVTRHWLLQNVDYPILMSYFGCTVESQQQALEKYLQYADSIGKKRTVSIAILLGGKSIGRETSCERLLKEPALQRFLWDLDAWARKNHPSYRGIVIETNLRQPIYNIHLN